MEDWTSEYITLLDDCENRQEFISEWECTFVDSMREQLAKGRAPTPRQIETLENIWEKATKRG
jgi:hypothetical protein